MNNNITLREVKKAVYNLWPEGDAESWDNVGVTIGSNDAEVTKIMFALDVVRETVNEAIDWGADLLFTHHPLMLRGVMTVSEETYKGALISDLIRNDCALLSAHTNADVQPNGVSVVIANTLGLKDIKPIVPSEKEPKAGLGCVGVLEKELSLEELAIKLTEVLPKTAVGARVAGDRNVPVKKVALLGGAGDSLLGHPNVLDSDVYITSDLRHHPAQESLEQSLISGGPALIDVPHWASESLWMRVAANELSELLSGVETRVSEINTDPWTFRIG